MSKYIDSEKLIAEITRIYNEHQFRSTERYEDGIDDGYHDCCDEIVAVITSLQQEQPSLPSDLDEAAEEYYDEMWDELGGIAMVRNNDTTFGIHRQ